MGGLFGGGGGTATPIEEPVGPTTPAQDQTDPLFDPLKGVEEEAAPTLSKPTGATPRTDATAVVT